MTQAIRPGADWFRRLSWWSLSAGGAALALCCLAGIFVPTQFYRAYLTAYLFFLSIAHGCFAILMMHHLTGGAWGRVLRGYLEAGMRTLPLLAILFVPIALSVHSLYPWANVDPASATAEALHQRAYLNVLFFLARAVVYFALWLSIAFFLDAWSSNQDDAGEVEGARRLAQLSGVGLAVYGITISLAAVDWVMSLQPAFRSSIFGPLFASGELLSGFAAALVGLSWILMRRERGPVEPETLNDLGSLLFTFLVIWAYMVFFQFMLIWMGNLPYDVSWYVPRMTPGWQAVVWTLVVLHFAVPFFMLLVRDVKRNPVMLGRLAGLILVMHLVYLHYQVQPAFDTGHWTDYGMDAVAPVAIGGLWFGWLLRDLAGQPLGAKTAGVPTMVGGTP